MAATSQLQPSGRLGRELRYDKNKGRNYGISPFSLLRAGSDLGGDVRGSGKENEVESCVKVEGVRDWGGRRESEGGRKERRGVDVGARGECRNARV